MKFNIFKTRDKKNEWRVIFRTRYMEVKSLRLMAKDKDEAIKMFRGIFIHHVEYIECIEVK